MRIVTIILHMYVFNIVDKPVFCMRWNVIHVLAGRWQIGKGSGSELCSNCSLG